MILVNENIFKNYLLKRKKEKKNFCLQLFINSIKIVLNFFSPLINILKTGIN